MVGWATVALVGSHTATRPMTVRRPATPAPVVSSLFRRTRTELYGQHHRLAATDKPNLYRGAGALAFEAFEQLPMIAYALAGETHHDVSDQDSPDLGGSAFLESNDQQALGLVCIETRRLGDLGGLTSYSEVCLAHGFALLELAGN